jgi:hypothetical protein
MMRPARAWRAGAAFDGKPDHAVIPLAFPAENAALPRFVALKHLRDWMYRRLNEKTARMVMAIWNMLMSPSVALAAPAGAI